MKQHDQKTKKETGSKLKKRSNRMVLEQRFMFDGAALIETASQVDATDAFNSLKDGLAPQPPLHFITPVEAIPAAVMAAQAQAQSALVQFAGSPEGARYLDEIFLGSDPTASPDQRTQIIESLLLSLQQAQFSVDVEIRSDSDLQGALGAFASNRNGTAVIYLNETYAHQASASAIAAVLLEEFGHALDHHINGSADTPGDEGHAFAALLMSGNTNFAAQANSNDHQTLMLDGQAVSIEAAGPYNIAQTTYVPLPEPDVQTALKAIAGSTAVSGNIQTVIAISSTANGTVVVYDQWEDGYEADINNPTQGTTLIWGDGDTSNGTAPGTTNDLFNAGQTILLQNAINPTSPTTVDYDGRDKIGSTKAISVSKAGWSSTPGTVLAGAVAVIDSANAGKVYTLPVGQNVDTVATGTNKLFEYTSAHIIATQNGTTITIDKDGNGTVDATVTLNEGQTYMVNGGLNAGGKIIADKNIGVYLIAGDVGSAYENRWFALTPDTQWSSSYFAPVGTTLAADPAYVIIYNPNASAITVRYDTATQAGQSLTVNAGSTNYVLMPASAAHFYTTGSEKFYAVSVIDADATSNATHDWSYSLVPETYLTTKFVVAWGPGNNNSPMTGATNGSPVWVTTTADTSLYIDSSTVTVKNSSGGSVAGTLVSGNTYKYSVKALESYRLFDTSDNDQSGLTVYTTDGTLITGAWGEDPSIAGAGNPFLDMGTTVLPFPDYIFTKESQEANATDANTTVELGEQVQYTLTAINRSVIEMLNPSIADSWTPSTAVTYVANSATLTVYDTDGVTVIQQITDLDGAGNLFPLSGAGYTLTDVDPNVAGVQGLTRGQKIVVTYKLQLPQITDTTALGQLAGSNFQISNSASLNDQSGVTKQSIELTTVTNNLTDGEVFFYDASYASQQTTLTPGNAIGLVVTDADQNQNSAAVETLSVVVTNTTTGETETVTLNETGMNTGIFRNTLATSTSASLTNNDQTLKLNIGNTVKVEYTDPTTGSVFDKPSAPGITGNFASGNANLKTAVAISNITPTDGEVLFYYDSSYTVTNGNYLENGTLYIQVTDNDQNFSAGSIDTVKVTVTNLDTQEIETLTLTETGVNSGVFRAALATSNTGDDIANNSGVMDTAYGDSIRVDYTDPISGATSDNPSNPGTNANRDTAAVANTKILYLAADAASGDGTGDLNRVDPTYVGNPDPVVDSTQVLTGNLVTNNTAILSVAGNAAGSTQTIATTSTNPNSTTLIGQSFVLAGTTIGKIQLDLADRSSPNNTGRIFAYLRSSWNGPNLAIASIDASTVNTTSAYRTFDFTDVTGLTSGATYYIVLQNQSSDTDTDGKENQIRWRYGGSGSGYASGSALNSSGSAQSYDYNFKIFSSDTATTAAVEYVGGTSSTTTLTGASTLYAQSFLISGTGSYTVDKLSLSLKDADSSANSGYVHIYLRSTINGDNLATASVKASDVLSNSYQLIDFDFANNPSLSKGTTYYLILDNQSSGDIGWEYTTTSTYSGGSFWANSSTKSASYSATTSKDFIVNVMDPFGSSLISIPYATAKTTVGSNAYAGESFNIAGTGSYVLDKVKLLLDDPDSANTGTISLSLVSGSINGTVLATATVNASTLSQGGVLSSVTFDLTNTTLNKGTTYYLRLNNNSNNIIDWARADYNVYSSGSSYNNATTASTATDYQFELYEATTAQVSATFSQSIPMAEDFNVPAGGSIKIVSYISALSGGSPTTGNITANLTYGTSGSVISLSNFTYTALTATTGYITWTGNVSTDVNVAAGEAFKLNITNNQSGLAFSVDYDSNSTPSRIELPTPTIIKVEDISFYDNSYANGGNLITGGAVYAGATTYIRVKVSDPFGDADIRNLLLSIDGPATLGDVGAQTLSDVNVIDANDNGPYKIYEYAWQTIDNTGAYSVNVTANEGFEGTISANGTGSIAVSALDLGTPSKTEFITALRGANAGSNYDASTQAFLRVTDMDEAGSGTVKATVNGVTFTLTETASGSGIFEVALTGNYTESGSTKSFSSLSTGTVLVASYTDNGRTPLDSKADSTDISSAQIAVATPDNTPPSATDNDRTISENAPASGTSLISTDEGGNGVDTDADGNAITVIAINGVRGAIGVTYTLPSGATVNVSSSGGYTYDPNGAFNFLAAGETATDSFDYTISDGNGGTSTATVTMTINGVADPSISVPDNNGSSALGQESVAENATLSGKTFSVSTPAGLSKITLAGTDITAASLTGATAGSPISVTTSLGTIQITGFNAGTGTVTYNYAPTASRQDHSAGAQSVIDWTSLTVTDLAGTVSATNSIGILITDTAPTANPDTNTVTEDSVTTTATGNVITGTGADTVRADSASTTVTGVAAGNTGATLVNSGTVGADIVGTYGKLNVASTGGYTYTLDNSMAATNALAAGSSGTDVFTYTIRDADGSLSQTTVTITVQGSNDAPVAKDNTYNAALNQVFTGKNLITNVDTTAGADSDVDTATANLVIDSVTVGVTQSTLSSLPNGTGGYAAWKVLTLAHGTAYLKADGSFNYLTASGDTTGDTFSYAISDGTATSANAVVTIHISASNTAPVATDNSYTVTEDTLLTGKNVITDSVADSDAENDQLTISTVNGSAFTANSTDPAHLAANGWMKVVLSNGTLYIKQDGTTDYQPSLNNTTGDSFTYTISDGTVASTAATVTLSVTAVNDPPVLDLDADNSSSATNADYAASYMENAAGIPIVDTDASITDVDNSNITSATIVLTNAKAGDSLTVGSLPAGVSSVIDTSTAGQITVTLSGSASKANYQNALKAVAFSSSSMNYTSRIVQVVVNDGQANSNTATATIAMAADNRSLSINTINVAENSPYATFVVTGNSGQHVQLALAQTGSSYAGGDAQLNVDTANPANGTLTTTDDVALQYSIDGGATWSDYATSSFVTMSASTMLVRTAISNDIIYEGPETFKLIATNSAGMTNTISAGNTGVATIYDNGQGDIYKPDGTIDPSVTPDDDRPTISVSSVTVNEASPFAVFKVSLSNASTQAISFTPSLSNGSATISTDTQNTPSSVALEYFDGTNWVSASGGVTLAAGSTNVLLRTAIKQDSLYEISEAFTLGTGNVTGLVTNTSGASGTGTIKDDGTGDIFLATNNTETPNLNTDPGYPSLDNDTPTLSVSDVNVNEGSPYAVFTVSMTNPSSHAVSFTPSLASGTATVGTDLAGTNALEYFDTTSQTWKPVNGGTVSIPAGATSVLIRTAIVQDDVYERSESFRLIVSDRTIAGTTVNTSAYGTGTITDDGTGNVFLATNKTATPNDPKDTDNTPGHGYPGVLDDDRPRPIIPVLPPAPPQPAPPAPPEPPAPPPPVVIKPFNSAVQPLAQKLAPPTEVPGTPIGDVLTNNAGFRIVAIENAPPGLTVNKGITDQFVEQGTTSGKFAVPYDAFMHSKQDAIIKLQAKLADDSPLPKWVVFDPQAGTFEVKPPANFKGKIELKVMARDDDGREATSIFRMFVGEEPAPEQKPQSRSSLSEKIRLAAKRPVPPMLVKPGDLTVQRKVVATERAHAG